MLVGAEGSVGLVAVAEAPQVRREQTVAIGEPRHHRLPGEPEFGPAMQQQKRLPCPGPRDMEGGAISPNRQVLHRTGSFSCSVLCTETVTDGLRATSRKPDARNGV